MLDVLTMSRGNDLFNGQFAFNVIYDCDGEVAKKKMQMATRSSQSKSSIVDHK